jgi:hypothetical protein
MRQVLVWCSAVDSFESADEMKFGITRLIRDISSINGLGEVVVNEQLRLHDAAIKIYFGQSFRGHSNLFITANRLGLKAGQ